MSNTTTGISSNQLKFDERLHSHPQADQIGNGAIGLLARLCSYSAAYNVTEIAHGTTKHFGTRSEHTALLNAGLISRTDNGWRVETAFRGLYNQERNDKKLPLSVKLEVIGRDFGLFRGVTPVRCRYCNLAGTVSYDGERLAMGEWHIDHIVPRSKHGTNHMANLCVSCASCNTSKGDKLLRAWRAMLENQPPDDRNAERIRQITSMIDWGEG